MEPEDQLKIHRALHSNTPYVDLTNGTSWAIFEMPYTRLRYLCIGGEKYLQKKGPSIHPVTQIIRPGPWGLIQDEVILIP